uniref:Lipocalin 14 n=1 Tax=Rhipicephalus microplus TaxID=6941 RepID=A0A034WWJ5_RHIMP
MGLAVASIKFLLLIALTQASRGPNKLQQDLPDSFKIFQAFENPIGMIDTNNDSVLECLSARRAEIDPETQTATYVWSLAGDDGKGRKYIPFYHSPGRTPDETRFSIGSKNRPGAIGHFLYTDYMNCAILEIPYHGDPCGKHECKTASRAHHLFKHKLHSNGYPPQKHLRPARV